mgnify:CR=1 FL=1
MIAEQRLNDIEKELKDIKSDLNCIKEQLTSKGINQGIAERANVRIGTNKEIIVIVVQTVLIALSCLIFILGLMRIHKEIDNIATPTGIIRGDKFIPFPSDSKVVRYPDNYQPPDTTK